MKLPTGHPSTWSDETLDSMYEQVWHFNVLRGTPEAETPFGQWINSIKREAMRRSEIRLNRREFDKYDGEWYDPRKEAQS